MEEVENILGWFGDYKVKKGKEKIFFGIFFFYMVVYMNKSN